MVDRPRPDLQLVLAAPSAELAESLEDAFAGMRAVRVHGGVFQELFGEIDGLITPGNSYGQMDGGIDGVISRTFPAVQKQVWGAIAERHHGYQPVGTAEVVATKDHRCSWLVYAPTMRMPMRLDHGRDVAIHDALWAALLSVERFNTAGDEPIRTIGCPGLGTGVGGVPPTRAAELMATAYRFWRAGPDGSISERESAFED